MDRSLDNVRVIDLNAGCETWVPDIQDMLRDTARKMHLPTEFFGLSEERIAKRFAELRYVFLLSSYTLTHIRRRCSSNANGTTDDSNGRRRIKELEDAFNAPEDDGDDVPRDNEESLWGNRRDDNESRDRPASEKPIHPGVESIGSVQVVDVAGLYIRSAGKFFGLREPQYSAMADNSDEPDEEMRAFCKTLPHHSSWEEKGRRIVAHYGDGPAIVLCPGAILSFCTAFLKEFPGKLHAMPNPAANPVLFFVKATLLHELGHHVFPVSYGGRYLYLSEGLATLFSWPYLSENERLWIFAKSLLLSLEYSTWRFLVDIYRAIWQPFSKRLASEAFLDGYVPPRLGELPRLSLGNRDDYRDYFIALRDRAYLYSMMAADLNREIVYGRISSVFTCKCVACARTGGHASHGLWIWRFKYFTICPCLTRTYPLRRG